MKLSIIIVSWNTCDLAIRCVKSIFKFIKDNEFEVFVVDNNSTDNTVEELRKYKNENNFGNLKIISNKENFGFAKANNQAIRIAKGNYILLLNPDTELIDDSVIKMIEFMQKKGWDPFGKLRAGSSPRQACAVGVQDDITDIGIVGPKLLNTDGTIQKSCRKFPSLLDQLFIQLKFYNFFPNKIKWVRDYFMLDFEHNEIKEVDQVMGAAMLIRRKVFDKIGLLDEKFFATFEEVDFCKRAKDAGYKIIFYPECQIIHHKEQSFKKWPSLRKQINFNHSLYYYFKKHNPEYSGWQFFVLWLIQPVNLFLTWVDGVVGIRKRVGKCSSEL